MFHGELQGARVITREVASGTDVPRWRCWGIETREWIS